MPGIIRNPTEVEQKNFKDVKMWKQDDPEQILLAKATDVYQNTIHKKRKPFCMKCAKTAIEEKTIEIAKLIKRNQLAKKRNVEIKVDIDFTRFGGNDNFERLDDTEIQEDKLLDGMKQKVQTGYYQNYVCKTCDSNLSMEFTNRELEATTKTQLPPVSNPETNK